MFFCCFRSCRTFPQLVPHPFLVSICSNPSSTASNGGRKSIVHEVFYPWRMPVVLWVLNPQLWTTTEPKTTNCTWVIWTRHTGHWPFRLTMSRVHCPHSRWPQPKTMSILLSWQTSDFQKKRSVDLKTCFPLKNDSDNLGQLGDLFKKEFRCAVSAVGPIVSSRGWTCVLLGIRRLRRRNGPRLSKTINEPPDHDNKKGLETIKST